MDELDLGVVVMESPSLLGFLLGRTIGTMNEGEAGADNACAVGWLGSVAELSAVVELLLSRPASRGKEVLVLSLLIPVVLTERFLVFRGLLLGECERIYPELFGEVPPEVLLARSTRSESREELTFSPLIDNGDR
jgi:hypothetical protein